VESARLDSCMQMNSCEVWAPSIGLLAGSGGVGNRATGVELRSARCERSGLVQSNVMVNLMLVYFC
jgi:hypothetical protein